MFSGALKWFSLSVLASLVYASAFWKFLFETYDLGYLVVLFCGLACLVFFVGVSICVFEVFRLKFMI